MLEDMEDLRSQTERLGHSIEEQQFVFWVIWALPDDYNQFKNLVLHRSNDNSGYGAYHGLKEELLKFI